METTDIPGIQSYEGYLTKLQEKISAIQNLARKRVLEYHQRLESKHKVANPTIFKIDDMVYVKILAKNKLYENWVGPLQIKEKLSERVLKLRWPSGKEFHERSTHVNRIKRAYIRCPEQYDIFKNEKRDPTGDIVKTNVQKPQIRKTQPKQNLTKAKEVNPFYQLNKILERRVTEGKTQYLGNFKNYPSNETYWLNECDLTGEAIRIGKLLPLSVYPPRGIIEL